MKKVDIGDGGWYIRHWEIQNGGGFFSKTDLKMIFVLMKKNPEMGSMPKKDLKTPFQDPTYNAHLVQFLMLFLMVYSFCTFTL